MPAGVDSMALFGSAVAFHTLTGYRCLHRHRPVDNSVERPFLAEGVFL